MNKQFFIGMIWCAIFLGGYTLSFGQAKEPSQSTVDNDKPYYSFKNFEWVNPWINSMNGAGLGLLSRQIPHFVGLSDLSVSMMREQGELRLPYTAPQENHLNIGTRTLQKINKTTIKASFNYEYNTNSETQWNALYDMKSTPFFVTDSNAARINSELFMGSFNLSHPINDKLFLGVQANYQTAVRAKTRDLRFTNNYVQMTFLPGIVYQKSNINIGISGGLKYTAEDISFGEVEKNIIKQIFYVKGIWFVKENVYDPILNHYNNRKIDDLAFLGQLQFEYKTDKINLFNQVGVDTRYSKQYHENYRHGDVHDLCFSYRGLLQFRNVFSIEVNADYLARDGISFIQQQITQDGKSQIITIGEEKSYLQKTFDGELYLTYRDIDGYFKENWEFVISGDVSLNQANYFRHPIDAKQDLTTIKINTSFSKFFYFNKSSFEITPKITLQLGSGDALYGRGYLDSDYQASPLNAEFYFNTSTRTTGGISFEYSTPMTPKLRGFIAGSVCYQQAFNNGFEDQYRSNFWLSTGIKF